MVTFQALWLAEREGAKQTFSWVQLHPLHQRYHDPWDVRAHMEWFSRSNDLTKKGFQKGYNIEGKVCPKNIGCRYTISMCALGFLQILLH